MPASTIVTQTPAIGTPVPDVPPPNRRDTYRQIAQQVGCSVSTVWRVANHGRARTHAAERRHERQMAVYVARYIRGMSIRMIAAAIGATKSTIDRDLAALAVRARHGHDVRAEAVGWFARHVHEVPRG